MHSQVQIFGGNISMERNRALPSRAEVQESLLDRLDPVRQVEKLSDYFLRRKRLAEIRGNYMYFYTDLPKPFDKKGLLGVNVHTGKDARFILVSDPDRAIYDRRNSRLALFSGRQPIAGVRCFG